MSTFWEQIEEMARTAEVLPPLYWVEPRPVCEKCRMREVQMSGYFCELCTKEQAQGFEALSMTGRCANGAQRDAGILYHAVKIGEWKAVCGAVHGRRSRWSEYHGEKVTCKRCIKKLEIV